MEYVIAGDSEQFKDCLIYVVNGNRDGADRVLRRMLTEPTPHDEEMMKGLTNIRVEEVEDGWWLHGCD